MWLKYPDNKPKLFGYYWGVVVVIRPIKKVVQWAGAWFGETPFYFWSERLPSPDWPNDSVIKDVMSEVETYT